MNTFVQRLFIILSLLCLIHTLGHSTHNRAGEITYQQINDLTIRITVTTYTKASSISADRDSVHVFWGDGSDEFVNRSNGTGELLVGDIKVNYYISEHTYPGRGTYTIAMMDPNRVADILNVNFPNSVNVPFYIETTFTFLNPQFQGLNNSAILLQAPIDFACSGEVFIHNPNAYDVDGDSLAYRLVQPFQDVGVPVPNYQLPDQISPGINNNISINRRTGTVTWNTPQSQGEYNIAIRIDEYREGVLINSITRDLQIFVSACNNTPPTVNVVNEICVIAGEQLVLDVSVTDPDAGQMLMLSASGGPFEIEDPAQLMLEQEVSLSPLNAQFIWNTTCNHISDQYYQVVFRGVDDFLGDAGLADLRTVRIKVVGPAPDEIFAESEKEQIKISWASPYACEETNDNFFKGFSLWRKEGNQTIPNDNCNAGLENSGYEKIIFLTNEREDERYFAFDDDVEKGVTYCYRVLGEFSKNTTDGNPFNKVQSLPSEEICRQLSRDLPLITKASVVSTDPNSGQVLIEWTKPLPDELDTLLNPGPYRYQLKRKPYGSMDPFVEIEDANFIIENFADDVDSSYIDSSLNTTTIQYQYQVDFYAADLTQPFGETKPAATVFLSVMGQDKSNDIVWEEDVPWNNMRYTIYRTNIQTGDQDSIGESTTNMFRDMNLENGQTYCYTVRAFGTYAIPGIDSPLINDSQESCGTPMDNMGPCSPSLTVTNICQEADANIEEDDITNNLIWSQPNINCENSQDLERYELYFSPLDSSSFSLIQTIDDRELNAFEHRPESNIIGCYYVIAIDSLDNKSDPSVIRCVDDCPLYELPNVFTPNEDNANDRLTPINSRFIESIDLKVFNRWGQLVFETRDPAINWDGRNFSGKDLAEGTYYYTCRVFEINSGGLSQNQEPLTGYIHLYR